MLKKETICYECDYCGKKYDTEEDCSKCEAKHLDLFNAESSRFEGFKTELANIYTKKLVRPKIITKEKVIKTIKVDSGEKDSEGNPILIDKEVIEFVDKETIGELPNIHCSKCLKKIPENALFVKVFSSILCTECSLPVFRLFAKLYGEFKSGVANMLTRNNTCSIIVDKDGNIDLHGDISISAADGKGLILSSFDEKETKCSCKS